jgi:hypothetical protein
MAQVNYKLSLDLGAKADLMAVVNATIYPLAAQAVRAIAQQTAANWIEAVGRAKLWSGEKTAYASSIKIELGDLSADIWSDYREASEIETGRPAKDLKKMLDTSAKVRVSKAGKRYLIIPFRHGTPGAIDNPMPASVYAQALGLKPSRITGMGSRVSGTGAYDMKTKKPLKVAQRQYAWGDRLIGDIVGKKHQGMVRMNTSTAKSKRSTYLTFRVMVEGSKGWVIAPRPGQQIVSGVVSAMQPLAAQVLAEAFRRSV